MKKKSVFCGLLLAAFLLAGCQSSQLKDVRMIDTGPAPVPTPDPIEEKARAEMERQTIEERKRQEREAALQLMKNASEDPLRPLSFSIPEGFYAKSQTLTLTAPDAMKIFYTNDGSEPSYKSLEYTRPLSFLTTDAELPNGWVIRAIAYYADGRKSPVETRAYFLHSGIFGRFSLPVLSIAAAPDELTDGPSALLTGERALDTGAGAVRSVDLRVFSPSGERLLGQEAELRVWGGESRAMPVKSLELTAKSAEGFAYDPFGGGVFPRRLVLSAGEDDFQYAFIRDELAQTVARSMGFSEAQRVLPAVVYINGAYYGLHWLHEARDYAAEGLTVIDWRKNGGEPETDAARVFRAAYEAFLSLDLQEQENYERLRGFLDVEQFLDSCALNILIDNQAWPDELRLYAALGSLEDAEKARWRVLPWDMDRAFGWKGGEDAAAADTLREALTPDSARYAPLFARLMQREDCRAYFVAKCGEYLDTAFAPEALLQACAALDGARSDEMQRYFSRLETLRLARHSMIWTKKDDFRAAVKALNSYLEARPAAVRSMLESNLPPLPPRNDAGPGVP